MVDQQLDPSLQEFKQFINQYPQLCEDIHSKKINIQTLYEKWAISGEDDPYWFQFKERSSDTTEYDEQAADTSNTKSSNTADVIQTIMSATKNMDMNKIQTYVEQVSSAVQSVQEVVQQFNKNKKPPPSARINEQPKNEFFQWMRD